ncbi:MAG: DUF3473 domain-containing protein [Phycisphaera sp.]|nr:DUF3473 domain-containing protein [Phycisphaera sp.]
MIQRPSNPTPESEGNVHCVSIDVEDYFHIESAYQTVGPSRWHEWPSRVERNVDLLLKLFNDRGQRGTFFILGHVAREHPHLAPRIADAGHEIASHGFMHDRLHRLNPDSFKQDLGDSLKLLSDQTGRKILGYRAPTFSVTPQTSWAIDVMLELGLEYDASIFPVRHPLYGVPDAPVQPFFVRGKPDGPTILEVPPLTWRISESKNLAVAGGGYFRLLPLGLMKRGLNQAQREGRPSILYFHPWEFDPEQPRMPLSLTGRLRTYTGLKTAARKLDSIMQRPARWTPIAEALDELRKLAASQAVYTLEHV